MNLRAAAVAALICAGLAGCSGIDRLDVDPAGDRRAGLIESDRQCLARLESYDLAMTPVAPFAEDGCRIDHAVRLTRIGEIALSRPAILTCGMAERLMVWQAAVLQPTARRTLGTSIVRLDHHGAYTCRTMRGRNVISEHAFANAIDIAGFRFANGHQIRIASHWSHSGAVSGFLRQAALGACSVFSNVLGPDYDAAHSGHLHLDAAADSYCGVEALPTPARPIRSSSIVGQIDIPQRSGERQNRDELRAALETRHISRAD